MSKLPEKLSVFALQPACTTINALIDYLAEREEELMQYIGEQSLKERGIHPPHPREEGGGQHKIVQIGDLLGCEVCKKGDHYVRNNPICSPRTIHIPKPEWWGKHRRSDAHWGFEEALEAASKASGISFEIV